MCNYMDYLAPNDRTGTDLTGPDKRMLQARNRQSRSTHTGPMTVGPGDYATMESDWHEMGSFSKRHYRGGATFTKDDVRTK